MLWVVLHTRLRHDSHVAMHKISPIAAWRPFTLYLLQEVKEVRACIKLYEHIWGVYLHKTKMMKPTWMTLSTMRVGIPWVVAQNPNLVSAREGHAYINPSLEQYFVLSLHKFMCETRGLTPDFRQTFRFFAERSWIMRPSQGEHIKRVDMHKMFFEAPWSHT